MKQDKPILIHTHFHKRRTGVTRSIENVFPFFDTQYNAYIYGYGIEGRKISFRQIIQLIFSKQQFTIHCHRNNEIIRALFFRLIGGKFKLISTRHAESTPSKLTKFLHKKTDITIALTNQMKNSFTFPTTVVSHGVPIDEFKPKKEHKLAQITQNKIISCVGRVREKKGQRILLEAISPLLKENKDWALIIVGKSDDRKFITQLKTIIDTHKISNQVYFLEETRDIISIYQATDICVIPSFTEGFSLVCAEAMACECTVVATKNVGVHSKMISNTKNGHLFEAGNVDQLRKLMQKIMTNNNPSIKMEARKEIVNNWSSEKEANALMNLYN